MPTPGNDTRTRRRSSARSSEARQSAGPDQPGVKLIASVVDEEERDERLGRSPLRAEVEPFAGLEVVLGEHERVLGAVAAGGVAAQPAEPPDVAQRHGHVPGDEIGQARAVAAGARDARPGFDGRRARIAGIDARDLQALCAMLEGECQRDAVLGRCRRRADEARRRRSTSATIRSPPAVTLTSGAGEMFHARPGTGLKGAAAPACAWSRSR